ncbi:MAG: thiamine pyrophosphate-dependent enzyme [Candidatus Bathyarchaeia archaeon]
MIKKFKEKIKTLREEKAKEGWNNLPIKPWKLIKELKEILPKNSIVVEECITSVSFIEHYFEFNEPNSLYGEIGGSLGWGFPAALGVKLANPKSPVIALIGNGSFLFSLQALWTASKYNIPVIAIIFNNSYGSRISFIKL